MPLGDSITRGDGGSLPYHGYRDTLANKLNNAGITYDLVGLHNDGDGTFDGDHQGMPGKRADEVADSVTTVMSLTNPDIVLVHVGTNDITQGQTVASTLTDIERAIDDIHAYNANAKILVAGIVPRADDANLDNETGQLNTSIQDLVNQKKGAGYKIWYVDHYNNFKSNANWATDYMSADGVHPNDTGYQVMADLFFTAIQTALAADSTPVVVDDFNRSGPNLGANWDADPAYQIVNNQLSNTSTVGNWVLATWIANSNPVEVSFRWANNANSAGINEGGLALRLDAPTKTANGYLIWLGTSAVAAGKQIILWTIENGAPATPVAEVAYTQPEPAPGDTFKVKLSSDANGHHFDVYINGTLYGRVSDPNTLQGNTAPLYAGIMLKGGLNNDVDDFSFTVNQDATAPATVTDLIVSSVSGTSVTLQWTAPGDDGNTGTAAKYEVRYSTSSINSTNFDSAILAPNAPFPSPAGTVETMTITGLSTGTTYYFRLKARDEAGNVSDLSNQASATTSSGVTTTDNFNRATLGDNWTADPAFQIVNNELHNTSTVSSWNYLAIFNAKKNPIEVGFTWGQTADAAGIDEGGFALMMDAASTTANGYLLFRRPVAGTIELWTIENGAPKLGVASVAGNLAGPTAGDKMSVTIRSDASGHHFDLYINGQLDGTVTDPNKLQGNGATLYAGVMLKGNLNNPIDDFFVTSELGAPSQIFKVSGDNQQAPVGQKLPQPLVVQVTDDNGNPIEGAAVDFTVIEGDGQIVEPPAYEFRVDVGGETAYTDALGKIWNADQAYSPGSYGYIGGNRGYIANAAIANTNDDELYKSERWGLTSYKIDLPNGEYNVFLHFAELVYQSTGSRVFSVKLEGTTVLNNFDIFATGGYRTAVVKQFSVTVTDGVLDIDFISNVENPNIHAIEVIGKSGVATTDASGKVSREFIVGSTVGTHRVQVSPLGFTATPVVFTATATAGQAVKIVKISGDNQSGAAGQPLAQPFVVEVQDSVGNPVTNYDVYFVATQGGGLLDKSLPVKTDSVGRASVTLTVGNQHATNIVKAYAPGLTGSPVSFTATATSGIAAKIEKVSGDNQTGIVNQALANPIVAQVLDSNNQPVPDFPVNLSVSGGGSTDQGSLLSNPTLEGNYYTHNDGLGLVAPGWGAWNPDKSETHFKTTGFNSASAQRLNTTGSAIAASIAQTIPSSNSPSNGSKVLLSFFYKASGDVDVALRVKLRKTLDSVLVELALPPTNDQWVHVTHPFIWDANYQPLQIHLVAQNNVIIDLDDVNIYHLTDSQGKISTTWTLGPTAGTQQLQVVAVAEGTPLTNSPLTFNATANAGPAAKLVEVSGNNQVGSANQPLPTALKVMVQDAAGNPKPGHPVTFQVTQGGGTLNGNLTTYTTLTDTAGIASAVFTLGPNAGVNNEVKASAELNGTPLAGSPITFTALAAVPAKMVKLSGDNQTGTPGRALTSPVKVQITDAQDRPISGFSVTFTVTQGGGTVNGQTSVTVTTAANGEASVSWALGTTPGAVNKLTVTALSQGSHLSGSPMTFTATATELAQLVLLDGNNQTGVVGTALGTPLQAKVIDQLGNGVRGWPVTFKVTEGGGSLDGDVTEKTVNTDSLGIARVTLTLGPKPGTNNNKVTASTTYKGGPLTGSPITFVASATHGAPVAIEKAGGDNQRGVVGSPLPEPLQVKVVDNLGNGVPNHNVTFEVKAGGGNINGQKVVNVLTNADGIAQVTLILGSAAGENNNKVEARAFSGNTPLGNSPLVFTASATNSPARNILYVSGSGQQGSAGQALAQKLVVKVTDGSAARNPVPNHPVTFKVTKGGGTLNGTENAQVVVATDTNGLASATWYLGGLTLPDSQQVEASSTDGQVALNGSPVVFKAAATAGAPSATKSIVEATGPVPADGKSLSKVTIYLKDNFGNPISGHAVIIKVSGSGNSINQPLSLTDNQGKATGSFSSTRAETKVVTAFDLNTQTEITNGATVVFEPLAAARLVLESGNNQTRNVGTALAEPLVAKVTDINGNPVANYPVKFEVESGGGYFIEMQPVRTDSNGLAKVTYVLGQSPGLNIVKAFALGLNVAPVTFNATGKSNNAKKMLMVSGNEQTGVAGEPLPKPLVVAITDENNDPIYNYPVRFRVTFGGGSVNGSAEATAVTNAFGHARIFWTLGEERGPNVLWAEADGLAGSPQIFTAQGTSGQPDTLILVSGDGMKGTVGQQAPGALVVKVTDQGKKNPVSNVIVRWELISGTGSLSAVQTTTNDNGIASVRFTFGNDAGPRLVRAYSDGLKGSPVSFHLYGQAAGPKSMAIVDGNNQAGTIGKPLSRPIRVKVIDPFNNPVPNANVTFVITAGGGSFVESQPVKTDERGIAKTTWILGPNPGQNRVWAVIQGVTNSPLEFVATGSTNNFPAFTQIGDKVINELDHIEFQVEATDADGDAITYGARNLPAGAAFDSIGTRIFSWTTGYADAGIHDIIFTARDSKGGLSEMLVTIKVNNVNRAPILANWQPAANTIEIQGGKNQTFQITAIDPDGDQIGYLWYLDGRHVGSSNTYLFQP
ncbi:MAG: Ig-like domain-containing protein [candidate division KSB1 bacterium]|nr:Ig-like domain-containing protein [candidate division KSB1 bacterium]